MSSTTNARLNRIEKHLGESTTPRGFTLEQLVEGSLGHDPGPPGKALQAGEVDLAELVATAEPEVSIS